MQEIHVKKRGEVYIVYLDSSDRPVKLGSYTDEPAGTFPQTYTSRRELEASWGSVLRFVEAPAEPERTLRRDPVVSQMADLVLSGKSVDEVMKQDIANSSSSPSIIVKAPVIENIAEQLVVEKENDARYLHALEVLERYKFALQHANKKAKYELELKITSLQELIAEVFE